MDPEDELEAGQEGTPAAAAATAPSPAAQSVMDSPEYKELLKQNRKLARDAGTAKAAEQSARAEAARIRQAAEAEQQAALEAQLSEVLGEEGVTEWNAIAELAGEDQVEAAKRFKSLMAKAAAQSPAPAAVAPTAAPASEPEGVVNDHPTPAAPPRSVDGSAPLSTQPGSEMTQLIGSLEERWSEGVKKNQDPVTRNRMTIRERGDALIGYLAAAYLKAGARGKQS